MQDVASANSGVLASNNRGEDFCCGDTSAAVLPNLMTDNNNDLGDQKTRLFPMEGTSSSAETVTIGSPTLAAKLEGLRRIASKYAHIRRVYDKYRGNDKGNI
jgi:hypothetical protein